MRAFVIHLEDAVAREPFVQELAQKLPIEVIKAFRGCDASLVGQSLAMAIHGRNLAPGEIGNAFSHLSVYMKMINEGIEEALIFEDDAKISDMLPVVVKHRHKLPADWELVNFFTHAAEQVFGDYIHDIYRPTRLKGYPNMAAAYMVKLSAAKKLVAEAFPIRFAADGLTGRSSVVSYGVSPRLATVHDTPSTIWAKT